MLRYVYASDLGDHPKLARTMFRDRADQFKTRLGWDVHVDKDGYERDEYDDLNPLYVIWEEPDGSHGGSMRFLPTTGRTMVNEHFGDLISGPITSPVIWECTRFCLARGAGSHVAAALMLGGGEIMQNFGIEHFVGVFGAFGILTTVPPQPWPSVQACPWTARASGSTSPLAQPRAANSPAPPDPAGTCRAPPIGSRHVPRPCPFRRSGVRL